MEMQTERFKNTPILRNAEADGTLLEEIVPLDDAGKQIMIKAVEKFNLSARGYHRILRVARTIADLADSETVKSYHISEALGFRRMHYK